MEEGEDVAADLWGEDPLPGDGALSAVGDGGGDHGHRLAVHLHRTALPKEKYDGVQGDHVGQSLGFVDFD